MSKANMNVVMKTPCFNMRRNLSRTQTLKATHNNLADTNELQISSFLTNDQKVNFSLVESLVQNCLLASAILKLSQHLYS